MEHIVRVVGFARVDEAMRLAVRTFGWVLAQRRYYHQQLHVADEYELCVDHVVLLCPPFPRDNAMHDDLRSLFRTLLTSAPCHTDCYRPSRPTPRRLHV